MIYKKNSTIFYEKKYIREAKPILLFGVGLSEYYLIAVTKSLENDGH